MAERKYDGTNRFERAYRIWEFLRKNTDKKHPITQVELRKSSEVSEVIGDKQTFNRLIKDMAYAMNCDEEGEYKPENEWKLYFDDFKRYADIENEIIEDEDDNEDTNRINKTMRLKGLYYNRTFSYEEVNSLIEGILSSRTLDTKTANNLIEKIEENLTTKFYKRGPKSICKVQEPELVDRELLRENLLTIQSAIDKNVQISFQFNGYTYKKELEPVRTEKDIVSPYYIVASGGRYYLLACKEITWKEKRIRNMSIWRIDLMTEIEIPEQNEKLGIWGKPRVPMRNVENLPMEWSEDFQLKHLNMSFDEPEWITLRIKSQKENGDPTKRIRPDYTFMHDWFGDSFRFIKTEEEAPYDDIVMVECSPYGMVNWALQYSDRVEVLEPKEVRDAVIRKIENLVEKYGMVLEDKSCV